MWCTLAVPFTDPSWKLPQVANTTSYKRVWKLRNSTQLRATWHTDSIDMVVPPSTGASRYQNWCRDGGTSPENFWYHLVCVCVCMCVCMYVYVMNGTVLIGLIVELCNNSCNLQLCFLLTLLTGNRVASAAQVGGSYYLNCVGTCSAIASELEKI